MTTVPAVAPNNGNAITQLGSGVFQIDAIARLDRGEAGRTGPHPDKLG